MGALSAVGVRTGEAYFGGCQVIVVDALAAAAKETGYAVGSAFVGLNVGE